MEQLIELDRKLFLFLNGLHCSWLDQPMYYISTEWIWIPFYAFLLFLIIKKSKKNAWSPILAIFIVVLLSDQISGKIKKTVERPRPTHDLAIGKKVHIVNDYRGGNFGFVSSHAANTFSVALFISLFLELSVFATVLIFAWAFLVTYSRVYLGVHFPLDLICGAILGMFISFFAFHLEKKLEKRFFSHVPLP